MKNIIVILAILANIILLSSCENKGASSEQSKAGHHEEHENANTTTLTAEQMKSIQLELGSIEQKPLTASLKANGILKVPNQNKAIATALIGGVVKSILVQAGNNVGKGQIIATIVNTTFISMQEEFLSVSSKTTLAELEFKRQQNLQAGNAGALKNLQATEAELKSLKARKASLQKQLELVGVNTSALSSENIQSEVNIISPIAGSVSNVLVNIGSYVDANNAIAEVIDNSHLLLNLFVYEKDLSNLKVGQTIHFTPTNNPRKEYHAKIYGINNTLEQNTKAIAVHATVEKDKTGLIDGMNITALVSLESATVNAVPTSAIVNYQGNDFIFIVTNAHNKVEHGDNKDGKNQDKHEHKQDEQEKKAIEKDEMTFECIPVRKGTTDIGYSEITLLKDIPADAQVVTKGAFFILAKMTNSGEHED